MSDIEKDSNDESSHEGGLPADNLREENESMSCGECFLVSISIFTMIIFFPFACCFSCKIVEQYKRSIIFRLGRIRGKSARGPGTFCIIPCTDEFNSVDLRIQTFSVPHQNVLTADSVSVGVNAIVYYKVVDPLKAVVNISNYDNATRILAQTSLRSVIGAYDYSDLVNQRDVIGKKLRANILKVTKPWGVEVESVEIRDITIPNELQRAMAAEAEATREARAKVIAADGELQSAKELRLAAEEINRSPTALQLRYLQTLSTISSENNHTIIFPMPVSDGNNNQGIADQFKSIAGGLLSNNK